MKLSRIQSIQDRLAQGDIRDWEWDGIVRELLRDVKVEYPLPLNQVRAGALHRVRTEGKIPAIKWYRTNLDCSLMEAKRAVEKLMEENGASFTGRRERQHAEFISRPFQPPKGKKGKRKVRSKLRLRHRVPPKPKSKKKSKTA